MTRPEIPEPNEENINACWNEWKRWEKTGPQEKALHLLFKERCPENTKIEDILVKVSVLNDFYKAGIFDKHIVTVSKHLLNCRIDKRLRGGDIDLVDKIARVEKIGKNYYSFASKYCSHHRPEIYPIYDGYVRKTLWHFKNKDKFLEFKKKELDQLEEYEKFLKIVHAFKRHYGLESCLRKIDIYLWLTGKKLDEQRRQGVHPV